MAIKCFKYEYLICKFLFIKNEMKITENRRIFLNIIFTYGRSLLSIVASLFISRWVLMALGQVDYGLFGVIGGMIVFVQFVNNVLAGATARFYAFSIGEAKKNIEQGLDNCRKWFNTALTIHTILPLCLIIVGYPLGKWAILNWLTIPPDRIESCLWVWRFTCFSSFVAMVNVPFMAMFTAKQYIAELTIYSMAVTILNITFAYFMVTHSGEWLTEYALWMCAMSVIPQIIICIRANCIFKECKIVWQYLGNILYLKKLGSYAGWNFFGTLAGLLRTQGISLLINKAFGPRVNASMHIAHQVNNGTSTLASALLKAFSPAIITACGAKDYKRMTTLAFEACKFSTLLALIFIIPVALELPEVIRVWLKTPPPFTVGLCYLMLVYYICDVWTTGNMIVVNASGKIKQYQITLGAISLFTIPTAILAVYLGCNVYSIGIILVISILLNSVGRIYFAQKLLNMSAIRWIREVMLPIIFTTIVCSAIGYLPHLWFNTGILRIVITTFVVEFVLFPFVWFFVLTLEEKNFIYSKIKILINKIFKM